MGLAISDPGGIISEPIEAIPSSSSIEKIVQIADERGAVEIVVGLPVSMDGTRSAQTRSTLEFVKCLQSSTDIPVMTWDERLSTVEAERSLRETGRRGGRDRGRIDSAAAAIILGAYLDSL